MNTFTRPAAAAVVGVLSVAALAGCAAGGGQGAGQGSGSGDYVEGGTFTFAMVSDPGSLDPQASAMNSVYQLAAFAYDSLLAMTADGELKSQLATDWEIDGTTITLTIADGVTCSDGSEFTAQTVVDNLLWIADPENQSPLLGTFLAPLASAEADGSTVVIELAAPAPFALEGLTSVPMICDAGLADRSLLTDGTIGTGPYVLTEAVANDHYTFAINEAYAWGPGGITTAEPGLPATVTARIIPNETTSANLVLSGEINAAQVIGPDAQRLVSANLFYDEVEAVVGEQWYNQNPAHITSDPAVRMALTQALDLDELRNVLTSGAGNPAKRLSIVEPSACTYDSVSGNVPATDVDAAAALLDEAGWVVGADGVREKDGQRFELSFFYPNTLGNGGTSAAELAVKQWEAIGVKVTAAVNDGTTLSNTMFGTGAWDILWVPLNVTNPDQVVAFFSGPAAPDGTNFASLANADYEAAVAEAMAMNGAESCEKWEEAEAALIQSADIVLFANNVIKTFGNGAEFELIDNIRPLSIRMLAK